MRRSDGLFRSPVASGRRHRQVCRGEPVIHRLPKVLLATQVAFGRLNRSVAQEKLNLLQLASTVVAQFSARPAKIVGCHALKPQFEAVAPHNAPDEVLADAATPHPTRPVDRPKQLSAGDSCC